MFGSSSGNFRGLLHGERGDKGGGSGGFGSHGQTNSGSSRSHWDVGSGNSEPVDVVSGVVDSLDDIVGINVLVASSGHSKGVL